jgi:hypothetical protein
MMTSAERSASVCAVSRREANDAAVDLLDGVTDGLAVRMLRRMGSVVVF